MAEKTNLFRRAAMAAAGQAKKIVFYLIIGIVSITVIFGAGMLNLWKDLVQSQREWLDVDAAYVQTFLDNVAYMQDNVGEEELLELISIISELDETFYSEVDNFYVRNSETGNIVGDGDTAAVEELFGLSARSDMRAHGRMYKLIPFDSRCTIILEISMDYAKAELRQVLPDRLRSLGTALAAYLLLLWLFMAVFKNEKKRDRAVSILLFLILILLTAADAMIAFRSQHTHLEEVRQSIYDTVGPNIDEIAEMSDEDVQKDADFLGRDLDRLQLVDMELDGYGGLTSSITYDPDTVLDVSIPIEERVSVTMDTHEYLNSLAEYLLEALMYAMLAVILFWGINYYHGYFGKGRKEKDPIRRSLDSMKLLSAAKSFADALTVAVGVTLLKSFLSADCGDLAGRYVSLTLLIMSLIAMVGALLLPLFVRLAHGCARLMPYSLALCIAGSLMCFLAQGSVLFAAGYLLVAVGDTLFGMMFILVPCDIVPADRHPMREVSNINISRYGGQVIGYVAGGTLAAVLPYRYMYLIAFALLALMFIPSVKIARMRTQMQLPSGPLLSKRVFIPRFLKFLLLIQAPYAMIAYYFKYMVPLNVDALGGTVTLVSFLFFVRMAMKLQFKRSEKIKAFWKKFPLRTAVLICMGLAAGVFLLLDVFTGVIGMTVCAILLALVETRFSDLIILLGYEVLDTEEDMFYSASTMQVTSRKFGKSLAATITQGLGSLGIPICLAGSAVLYLVLTIRDAKNQKNKSISHPKWTGS